MIRGGWAFRLPPIEGELLSSCLARNARAHGTSPQRFLELFWPGEATWNRDLDRRPAVLPRRGAATADWSQEIAVHLGVSANEVRRATLQGWRETLGDARLPSHGDTPLLLSVGVYHRKRLRHGLQYCPECLGEGTPHYRRVWRLAFAVACREHGRALLDACPSCDAPVVPHRAAGSLTDCHACGFSLMRASGGRGAPDGTVKLQQSLIALLGTTDPVEAAQPRAARDAFDRVRALLAASTARPVQRALRDALGLGAVELAATPRLRFEQSRIAVRIACLETVAAWSARWPGSFRTGAAAASLTQRSFARVYLDEALAAEVARLPAGNLRQRPAYVPILATPSLRRLRRRDPAAYRAARARCILTALGRTT